MWGIELARRVALRQGSHLALQATDSKRLRPRLGAGYRRPERSYRDDSIEGLSARVLSVVRRLLMRLPFALRVRIDYGLPLGCSQVLDALVIGDIQVRGEDQRLLLGQRWHWARRGWAWAKKQLRGTVEDSHIDWCWHGWEK